MFSDERTYFSWPRSSTLVTDNLFSLLAPDLAHLEDFHLIGCTKLTHAGVITVLAANETGVTNLGLEGLPASFVSLETEP